MKNNVKCYKVLTKKDNGSLVSAHSFDRAQVVYQMGKLNRANKVKMTFFA
jgi:hypothetical protein